jgi:hypothetical protein
LILRIGRKPIQAFAAASIAVGTLSSLPATAATLTPVDTELSLLMDVSGSIDRREFDLQIQGYRDAFRTLSPRFGNDFGTVAVNFVFWGTRQQEVIPWFLINDAASAVEFSNQIEALQRVGLGGTDPDLAIAYAAPRFFQNAFEGRQQVIDVSGDGQGNTRATRTARDNALALGVDTINGIAIQARDSGLRAWYEQNIRGGQNAFVIAVNDFEGFGTGIRTKLSAELALDLPDEVPDAAAVPEPSTMLMAGCAAVMGAFWKRHRKA